MEATSTLSVKNGRVTVDGSELSCCTYVGVKIDPGTALEVELRVVVDRVDIEYHNGGEGASNNYPLKGSATS